MSGTTTKQGNAQNWFSDQWLVDLPPRPITNVRILEHLLFWLWNGYSAYTALDRVLRVEPSLPPDPDLFTVMFTTHVGTTIVLFYLYGYLVVPSLLSSLVYYRATRILIWPKIIFVVITSASIFLLFNVYDFYLFSYAAEHYKPVPAYIKRYYDLLQQTGPLGIVANYSLVTFVWAYNLSYVLLPILIRTIREAISWGVESVVQREQNRILMQDQLQLLKFQINPHFLFNVFNNILALIQRTNREAAELLRRLSNMMHYTLYDTDKNFVPLAGELKFLENYIEIERSRHFNPEKIIFTKSGESANFSTPPLLLITFIENAFKHGLNSSSDDAWVTIDLQIDSVKGLLLATIRNSVSNLTTPQLKPGGVGLANARQRLNLLFTPNKYSLTVTEEAGVYEVFLRIPLNRVESNEFDHAYQLSHH
ncbi:histidine kinase (plasmid) [Spirosoma sp. SC4-14]|uniref:sensor histidine kinase n=1 Tax=Spirosoma sp. SC4-14 TaxID=3128900 RepID=UPI0030D19E56